MITRRKQPNVLRLLNSDSGKRQHALNSFPLVEETEHKWNYGDRKATIEASIEILTGGGGVRLNENVMQVNMLFI